ALRCVPRALRPSSRHLGAKLRRRPGALREDVAAQLKPRRALREREGVDAHAPGRNGREPVALDLRLLAPLDVAHAEVEGEAVVELQHLVLAAVLPEVAAELRL